MVPADDFAVGVLRIHLVVDFIPGIVGEGHVARVALGLVRPHRFVDVQIRAVVVAIPIADKHAADFQRELFAGVGGDPLVDRAIEIDAKRLFPLRGKGARVQLARRQLGHVHTLGLVRH